jgi:hypothetical protein
MIEREIIDRTNDGITQIKCNHCDGSGKCGCYNCCGRVIEEYTKYKRNDPEIKFNCRKCNGYGFLLLKKDGRIILPEANDEY